MVWRSATRHTIEAVGRKATYTLHRAPGAFTGCVLTATGHDSLPLLALPPYGKHFERPSTAKDYAEGIERGQSTEPLGGVG